MDTSLCTFHRVLGGPLSLVKKTDCHLPCNNIFLIFTTWYLRSHQSPHLESPSEGVAVARLCGRIPARNPARGGYGPREMGSCDPLALVDDVQHLCWRLPDLPHPNCSAVGFPAR